MANLRPSIRALLIVLAIAAATSLSYWLGYRAGVDALKEKPWALVTRHRRPDGTVSGSSYSWYNLNNPAELAEFHKEEARLKAAGIDFYSNEGQVETTINLKPQPSRADSQR